MGQKGTRTTVCKQGSIYYYFTYNQYCVTLLFHITTSYKNWRGLGLLYYIALTNDPFHESSTLNTVTWNAQFSGTGSAVKTIPLSNDLTRSATESSSDSSMLLP